MGAMPDESEPLEIIPQRKPAAAAQKQAIPEEGSFQISAEDESDLLGQMIGKGEQPQAAENKNIPAPKPVRKNNNSLDEIERSLGIR